MGQENLQAELQLQPNPVAAEMMLGNLGGKNSEISAVTHYFYNRLRTLDAAPALSALFHKTSMEEMQHLETFGILARQLGADPRLWQKNGGRMQYWSAEQLDYGAQTVPELLRCSIAEENAAIQKYQAQTRVIAEPAVVAALQRIIADEQRHVQQWQAALAQFG
jgi:bacterioferritin